MTVAFDLDGTLITAAVKQSLLLQSVAYRFRRKVEASEIWIRKREGMSNQKTLIDLGVDSSVAEAISSAWRMAIETPYWLSLDTVVDGAKHLLSLVAASGDACILVSARSNAYLFRQQVYQLGLRPYFAEIFCVSPANAAAEKADVLNKSGSGLLVGDSEVDYDAARLAGVRFEAVATGQRSATFLNGCGVPRVHATLLEIANALDGRPHEETR